MAGSRSSLVVIAVGVLAVVAAAVLSMYPRVADSRDAVERTWSGLLPQLDRRYELLTALSREVRAQGREEDLIRDLEVALSGWKVLVSERPTPDVDDEPGAANHIEGLAARLLVRIAASATLREHHAVVSALHEFAGALPSSAVAAYNDAVRRYDRARSRFPGRFFAGLLGFDALVTLQVPEALARPELPPVPTTTTSTAPPTSTTTAPGRGRAARA